mmetsp:Transcript_18604/g.18694  ORF Transcript_18604/g.18694 Transcript_18604/m.18694 type:complete len:128 (+) Transcript_18604:166-549(+)
MESIHRKNGKLQTEQGWVKVEKESEIEEIISDDFDMISDSECSGPKDNEECVNDNISPILREVSGHIISESYPVDGHCKNHDSSNDVEDIRWFQKSIFKPERGIVTSALLISALSVVALVGMKNSRK